MGKIFYTIFLAVASVKELTSIFLFGSNGFVELIYISMFIYIIIQMFTNSLPPWVWKSAYSIVGISALVFLVLTASGVPPQPIRVIDSLVCLFAWVKSLIYLNNFNHNENIGEI